MPDEIDPREVIERLYDAALNPDLWPQVLEEFARAVGGLGTAMIPITPGDNAGLVVSPALYEARIAYDRDWWQIDSRVARIHSRRISRGVVSEPELFTPEELKRDPIRQEFCRGFGIGAFAAQLSIPLPGYVVAFSVQRALGLGDFQGADLERMRILGAHAARAAVLSHQLGLERALVGGLAGTLTQLGCGAVLVDDRAAVLFANEAAERLFGDGVSVQHGQLGATLPKDRPAFDRLLHSARADIAAEAGFGPIAVGRPSGRRPLVVQAVPIGLTAAAPERIGHARPRRLILVLLVDTDVGADTSPIPSLRALGLTAAEARLAALIGAGQSRPEAAAALGISEWTARDALKAIYDKLGIARQSELVRLVDRLSALAGDPGRDRAR